MPQSDGTDKTDLDRRRAAIERTRGRLVPFARGRSLVEELIAEHRAEGRASAQAARPRGRGACLR